MKFRRVSLLTAVFFTIGLLAGCGDDDGGSGNSSVISTDTNSEVPNYILPGQPATLETELSVSGSQSSNAALFTLGADASEAIATIIAINYPDVTGLTFTQVIPNGSDKPDCVVGLSLTNEVPACIFKVTVEAEQGASVDDNIEIVSNVQTVLIPIVVTGVPEGSVFLPQGIVSPTPIVAPDTTTSIKVTNPSSNTESINNLAVTFSAWLSDIAVDLTGGTASISGGKKTITYTENSLSKNLAVGQSHTFSFTLDGDEETTVVLLAYYDELINNSSMGVITVTGSNLRNLIKPSLTVSLTPATMTESVTLSDPETPQTVTLQNLSNSQLQITGINGDNLPTGVTITGGSCANDLNIEPAGNVGDSCTVELTVAVDAVPEDNKTLSIDYQDPKGNGFEDSASVTIGGAAISVDLNSIALLNDGNQTTNVIITNTGELNWSPSNMAANYEITRQGESEPADNISVIAPTAGTSCLTGNTVAPGATCSIGIQTNADDTAIGNYVLSVLPANNLETTNTTNFNITDSTEGSFQFQDGAGVAIDIQSFEIGAAAFTLILKNVGAAEITGAYLTIPNKFTTDNPDSGTACPNDNVGIPLASEASCGIKLSVADGSGVGVGSYNIVATGDVGTVDNSGQTLIANIQGAVVTIESDVSITKPNDGATVTEVRITNSSANAIVWNPSAEINNYVIDGDDDTGISIVDPETANPYCVAGASVAVGSFCTVGIQVDNTANVAEYTLTLGLANNLAAQQSQSFDVTSTLGFFSFSQNDVITDNITMGVDSRTQPQTITLSNTGDTDITNVYLDYRNLHPALTVDNNNCGLEGVGDTITLNSGNSCTFQVWIEDHPENPQGESFEIPVVGDPATVENDDAEFTVNVDGIVIEIQTINGNQPINRPAAGTQTTNIELTNLGNIDWVPSTDAADYQIVIDNANISIVAPIDGVANCLDADDAPIAGGASCFIGIQTNTNTSKEDYTLQVLAATDGNENLPQASNIQTFTVGDSLGYFVYKDAEGAEINNLTLTIGDEPVTITLENIGETQITDIVVNDGADAGAFDVSYSGEANCGDSNTLAADASCVFDLELSDMAVADVEYTFQTTGADGTVSNSPVELTVTAEAPACKITVGGYEWTADANLGLVANAEGVPGVNVSGGMSFDTARGAFIDWLNDQNYCGHNDWALPTENQFGCTNVTGGACNKAALGGLLTDWDSDTVIEYLTSLGFTNIVSNYYRSGEISAQFGFPWVLDMSNGNIQNGVGPNNPLYVLPVRTTDAFITNQANNTVSRCDVFPDGSLNNCASTGSNFTSPTAITLNSDEDIAFVINEGGGTVTHCAVNELGTFSGCVVSGNLGSPTAIALNSTDTIAYIYDNTWNNYKVRKCNVSNTGVFSNCGDTGAIVSAAAYAMTLNGDGDTAYIANFSPASVTKCDVNNDTGVFSNCGDAGGAGFNSSRGIVLNNNSTLAFIVEQQASNKVRRCDVDANGNGNLSGCINVLTGLNNSTGIALNADNSKVFISIFGSNSVTTCDVNEADDFSNCIDTEATGLSDPIGIYITR